MKRHSAPYLVRWGLQRGLGILTRSQRLMPDFIIIGAQRCGTTSLFRYLAQHPSIFPAFPKEVHFFSNYFQKGNEWYRSHFPLEWYKRYVEQIRKTRFLTGEATPYYITHPHAPLRISETLPDARLIAILRNPVDRAYSHYHYEVQFGFETCSFEDALDKEEARLATETPRMRTDGTYRSFNYQHFSYLARGIYVDQLTRWAEHFSREQMLVLRSESFYSDPSNTLQQVVEFLNLPSWEFTSGKKYNVTHYAKMNAATRERLLAYFEPHNRRLYAFLDANFNWGT